MLAVVRYVIDLSKDTQDFLYSITVILAAAMALAGIFAS